MRRQTDFVRTFAIPLLFMTALAALAQTVDHASGSDPLSLANALALAQQKYPAIKAALEQQSAAKDQIGVAKTAYLPRVDMLWQTNRATENNRTGLMLPQAVLPSISGPVAVDAPAKVHGAALEALLSTGSPSILESARAKWMRQKRAQLLQRAQQISPVWGSLPELQPPSLMQRLRTSWLLLRRPMSDGCRHSQTAFMCW